MLGDSAVLGTGGGSSGDDAVAAVVAAAASSAGGGGGHDGGDTVVGGGGGGSNSGDEERGRGEEGDRSFGGNRWPRQETLALLRIRADMDAAFRDASVKGPLWEEVSRKLAELGYHRNAKKCKEKFENVYKYHKRTKEGRSGKSDGKTYRFFDQLEALENNPSILSPTTTTPQHSKPPLNAKPVSVIVTTSTLPIPQVANTTVPSTTTTTTTTTTLPIATTMPQAILNTPSINLTIPSFPPPNPTNFTLSSTPTNPPSFPNNIPTDLFSNSSSSSTSSDDTLEGGRRKRKRKWKDFFERLMKEVIDKQEELQRRFLEAIEKRERERVAREEAWRMQEMQRINREREILAQERSIAAAKDAAVMSFLQKIAEQQNLGPALNNSNFPMPQATVPSSSPPPPPPSQPAGQVIIHPAPHQHQQQQQQQVTNMEIIEANNNNNGENLMMQASSSRWPKVEVQALINLRTNLEAKYQETGPKGPLWEEISSLMRKIGYNRNAKRCKEKWENINKYFKKVKESNKKRPEDSKTCPYFHLLDALYKEKSKHESPLKLDTTAAPLMVRPEQQWPPQLAATAENDDSADHRPRHQHEEEDDDGGDDEEEKEIGDDDDDEDEDDEGGGNNYEIVASKPASSVGVSAE